MSFGEALLLVQELGHDTSSRYSAKMNGWKFPTTMTDVHIAALTQTVVNALKDKDTDPYRAPMPWPDPNEPVKPEVSESEMVELKEILAERSAFAD